MQLQEILEAPLLGPQGEQWRKQPRSVPEEFTLWVEAQSLSEEASKSLGKMLGIIFPLKNTMNKDIVNAMWIRINDVRSPQHLRMTPLMRTTDVQGRGQDGPGHSVAGRG